MKKQFIIASVLMLVGSGQVMAVTQYTITDLGTLGGSMSRAYGINTSGQVVGWSYTTGNSVMHAFLYDGTTMKDLGTLGGSQSVAYGINDSGQVVGYSWIAGNSAVHAFLYDGTAMKDLGTLGGSSSLAYGINNSGQVVGYRDDGLLAFLYDGGNMIDLNTMLPADSGWVLRQAFGINDSGQIAGSGDINGEYHAFLLIPEPATLLLLGIGGLVLRKKH